jgi:hypothetical protein
MDEPIQEPWRWILPQPGTVRVENGYIEVEPGHWEFYNPFDITNLPNTFAKVDGEKALISFVQQYGLLGYSGLSADPRGPYEGDLVEWALSHARAVRFALRLIKALSSGPEVKGLLEESITSIPMRSIFPEAPADLIATGHTFPEGLGYKFIPYAAQEWSNNFQHLAPQMLAYLVNNNTRGVRRQVVYKVPPGLQIQLSARGLIEVIWHQVGEMAVMDWHQEGSGLNQCRECGLLFLVTDRRQEFCPKAAVPGDRTGSICGARYRQRKKRGGA